MAMLVTIEQAAAHLRIDDYTDEVNDLTLKIQAASGVVLDYLEMSIDDFGDSDSDGREVPAQIQQATLLLIGDMHGYRGSGGGQGQTIFYEAVLPSIVRALLYPLKTWGIESV
jgi:hypothetical protein